MNLKAYVEQYVRYHQSLGKVFATQARILRAFVRRFDSTKSVDSITKQDVETFIREAGTSRYWYIKYTMLDPFFRYAIARGDVQQSPLPPNPPTRGPRLAPHVKRFEDCWRPRKDIRSFQAVWNQLRSEHLSCWLTVQHSVLVRSDD